MILLWTAMLFATLTQEVKGHGYMIEPAARSSMWRVGFNTPVNYNDNALRCGGSRTQCGVCGDPYDGPRDHETGGMFATGAIAKTYKQGEEFYVRVMVTANHQGWFYFNLCVRNDPSQKETDDCLENVPLMLADGRKRFMLRQKVFGPVNIRVKLPDDVSCSHCVLRWKWITGNSWGYDLRTGEGCLGCGPQEQFYGCSDIEIEPRIHATPTPPRNHLLPAITLRPDVSNNNGNNNNNNNNVNDAGGNNDAGNEAPLTRKCLAVNNWEGDADLDAWCQANCAGEKDGQLVYCPPVFCSCQLM